MIGACLEQIKWKRYRDGSYSNTDPYVAVKEILYRIRDGEEITLSKAEILLLYQATRESVGYISRREHLPETLEAAITLRNELHLMAFRPKEASYASPTE